MSAFISLTMLNETHIVT